VSAEDLRPTKDDLHFFQDHPDRKARIRAPEGKENIGEFWILGPHDAARRRFLLWRVPDGHPMKRAYPYLKIPFLAFADETIEDEDRVLLPLIDQIMRDARKEKSFNGR
jgi:hypothetical protein